MTDRLTDWHQDALELGKASAVSRLSSHHYTALGGKSGHASLATGSGQKQTGYLCRPGG